VRQNISFFRRCSVSYFVQKKTRGFERRLMNSQDGVISAEVPASAAWAPIGLASQVALMHCWYPTQWWTPLPPGGLSVAY
jgi:hypothetical protein